MAHELAHNRGDEQGRRTESEPKANDEMGRRHYVRLGGVAMLPLASAGLATGVTGSDADPNGDDEHRLLIDGSGAPSTYEFTVDGELKPGLNALKDAESCISGCNAEGSVTNGNRRYRFTGGLRALSVDGDAVITLDGKPIVP